VEAKLAAGRVLQCLEVELAVAQQVLQLVGVDLAKGQVLQLVEVELAVAQVLQLVVGVDLAKGQAVAQVASAELQPSS